MLLEFMLNVKIEIFSAIMFLPLIHKAELNTRYHPLLVTTFLLELYTLKGHQMVKNLTIIKLYFNL
jgi:hypothetical protein